MDVIQVWRAMRRTILWLLLILGLGGFLRFYHLGRRGIIYWDASVYALRAQYLQNILKAYQERFRIPKSEGVRREKQFEHIYQAVVHPQEGMRMGGVAGLDKDLYSYWIVFVSLVTGWDSSISALYGEAFFGWLNLLLLFWLAFLLFRNARVALLGAFFYAIFPYSLWYARSGYPEEMGFFFVLLALIGLIYGIEKRSAFLFCLQGLCLGLSFDANSRSGLLALAGCAGSYGLFSWHLLEEKKWTGRFLLRWAEYGFYTLCFFTLALALCEFPYYLVTLHILAHGKPLNIGMSFLWRTFSIRGALTQMKPELGLDNLTLPLIFFYLSGVMFALLAFLSLFYGLWKLLRERSFPWILLFLWMGFPFILFNFFGYHQGGNTTHAARYFFSGMPFFILLMGYVVDQIIGGDHRETNSGRWPGTKSVLRYMVLGGFVIGTISNTLPYDWKIMHVKNNFPQLLSKMETQQPVFYNTEAHLSRLYFPSHPATGIYSVLDLKRLMKVEWRATPPPLVITELQDEANFLMKGDLPVHLWLEKKGCTPLKQESQFTHGRTALIFFAFDHNNRLKRVLEELATVQKPQMRVFNLALCPAIQKP